MYPKTILTEGEREKRKLDEAFHKYWAKNGNKTPYAVIMPYFTFWAIQELLSKYHPFTPMLKYNGVLIVQSNKVEEILFAEKP